MRNQIGYAWNISFGFLAVLSVGIGYLALVLSMISIIAGPLIAVALYLYGVEMWIVLVSATATLWLMGLKLVANPGLAKVFGTVAIWSAVISGGDA